MSDKFRPMLAAETPANLMVLESKGFFPMYGSYKVDGIRAVCREGKLWSRTLKPIKSAFANEAFGYPVHEGMDGELLVQKAPHPLIYTETYSAVMTHGETTPLDWWVFDTFYDPRAPYTERLAVLQETVKLAGIHPNVKLLEQRLLHSVTEVLEMEQEALDAGWEGLIVRRADGYYKYNRSTEDQGLLIKVARRLTSECEIEDFEELTHNDNEATIDARGFQVRSQHMENLRGSGMLGALRVRDIHTNVRFKIGIAVEGLWTHEVRRQMWNDRESLRKQIGSYDFKPYGTMDAPRQPRWRGLRDPSDIGEPDDE